MTAPATTRPARRKWGPTILVVVVVIGSLATFVWNAIETSTARVNATTSANSVFSAGTVDLAQPFTVVELLFDADNLYPGVEVTGCVEVDYRGSVPADVRLHSQRLGGTGLEEYVTVRFIQSSSETCDDDGVADGSGIYEGTLGTFWREHGSYRNGIAVGQMQTGDRVVLHATASLVDDNTAQGLDTDFSLTVEARP